MKIATLLFGSIACVVGIAHAEDDSTNYPFDPRWAAHEQAREAQINQDRADYQRWQNDRIEGGWDRRDRLADRSECWNPRSRHFEAVRPAERQDDLDFSRCRPAGSGYWRH
jgi:hypothetical protein